MDLGQIELQVLQIVGVVVGAAILWLLKRALAWVGIRLSVEKQAALGSAVDKMMTLGVTQADSVIRADGWDHVNTKNAVINAAMSGLETKFSGTLLTAGINPNNPADRMKLTDMMSRMWPDVAARLAASPATPPAPLPPPIVVVAPVAAAA